MKRRTLCYAAILLLFSNCNKTVDRLIEKHVLAPKQSEGFTLYTIKQGEHYTSNNFYKPVDLSALNFVVRFDSSAVYKTEAQVNQFDINKLYGFSDNSMDHHQYSARFGWSWNENALRLYAYVYNDGKVLKTELGTVNIQAEINCSIKVLDSNYIFKLNDVELKVPRASQTATAKGYMLYPYFGGDETAPHDVHIWIKNL